jgi:hypothetical protein
VYRNKTESKYDYLIQHAEALLQQLRVAKRIKEFPAFYGGHWFTTVFTRAGPCLEPEDSSPHPHTLLI